MALSSLTCPPPIRVSTRPPRPAPEVLDAAIELFGKQRFKQSLQKTFAYLFPDREIPDVARKAFVFAQGSSRVTIRLKKGELFIDVPLVRIGPTSKSTAALRFLLAKESGTGQLFQPRLRGDAVTFEFRDKLHRLHPQKLVEVLRRMPVEADNHDDWMVDEFGVTLLDREPIQRLEDPLLDRAEAIWRTHWSEVQELLREAQRRRSLFFLNEVASFALFHARCSLPISGLLGARIAESASIYNDTSLAPLKRENALARAAREMLTATREDLAQSLGFAELSISPVDEGTTAVLDRYLGAGDYATNVAGARSGGRYMEAAVAQIATYCYLLARFAWRAETDRALLAGLDAASGRPWREVARDLTERGKALLEAHARASDDATEGADA